MHFSNTLFSLAALAASTVNAQAGTTVQVTVGANGALAYSPNDITAAVGTSVEFSFFPKNHSVIQSSFANPCHPLAGGFFSSFVPTKNSPSGSTFTITVTDTKPIWIYCGQTTLNHCQSGMVAAINAPAVNNTLAAFTLLAKNATTSTSPPGGAVGGVLSLAASNSSSSTSSSSSAAVSSKAVSTSAVLSTYTSSSHTYTTTVGSTTVYSSVAASSTSTSSSTSSSTSTTTTGAASGLVANVFNAGAVVFAVLAMF